MSSHNDGSIELLTGKTPTKEDLDLDGQERASRFRHDRQPLARLAAPADCRPTSACPRVPFMTQPTYLGMAHSGFAAGDPSVPNFRPPNLSLDAGSTASGWTIAARWSRSSIATAAATTCTARSRRPDQFRQQAFQLLTSTAVADAFALDQERPANARSLWPAPVGPELPAGPPAGRGRAPA